MSDTRKLYEVRVEMTYYAYTENEDSALNLAYDALDNIIIGEMAYARPIEHRGVTLRGGWDKSCILYGPTEDVTVGSVLSSLPPKCGSGT